MKQICVFCGSSAGGKPEYAEAACALGTLLAQRGLGLVYGGGKVGLMGHLARAVLAGGGTVIGVIPRALLEKEVALTTVTELVVVESMHARKTEMARLADGFIALPGGIGTLEEFFEVWTWAQLGLHEKPCGLLDVEGYFAPLIGFLDVVADQGFIQAAHRQMVLVEQQAEVMLARMASYRAPVVDKAAWALRRGEE